MEWERERERERERDGMGERQRERERDGNHTLQENWHSTAKLLNPERCGCMYSGRFLRDQCVYPQPAEEMTPVLKRNGRDTETDKKTLRMSTMGMRGAGIWKC